MICSWPGLPCLMNLLMKKFKYIATLLEQKNHILHANHATRRQSYHACINSNDKLF